MHTKFSYKIPVGTRPPNDQGVHWRTIQQTGWEGVHWIHLGDTGGSHGDDHEYIIWKKLTDVSEVLNTFIIRAVAAASTSETSVSF
jgi:hypothetical protein